MEETSGSGYALPGRSARDRPEAYPTGMHILHVQLRVKPERIDDFIAASIENAARSLQEPGCVRFDVIQEIEDPAHFEFVEIYRDQAAHAAHRESAHYKAWTERTADTLAQPRSRTFYRNVFPGDDAF